MSTGAQEELSAVAEFDELCGVKDWTLHDIRRTVGTKLAEWGCCDDAMAGRILGHVTAKSRISRVYNKWRYFPQMKVALEVYEGRLNATDLRGMCAFEIANPGNGH